MSLKILNNEPLAPYTTFRIGGPARYFAEVQSISELYEALSFSKNNSLPLYLLSGGSNVLVSDEGYSGLVIRIGLKGREVVTENSTECYLKVAAGEVWDEVVAFAVDSGLWGIENLSHIPGKMGGFPVQNVGAYGQEASQVIVSLDAYDKSTGKIITLTKDQCEFGYRQSIFNTTQKNRFIILFVRLRLSKVPKPNLGYKDLFEYFQNKPTPSIAEIRQAIIFIRDKKYPYPVSAKTGNSGSWFKNVFLDSSEYRILEEKIQKNLGEDSYTKFIKIIQHQDSSGNFKIPSALLLDICNLKKLKTGGVALSENQPLVIYNRSGSATAMDCLNLVGVIQSEVFKKLGIRLQIEPELVGFSQDVLKSVYK